MRGEILISVEFLASFDTLKRIMRTAIHTFFIGALTLSLAESSQAQDNLNLEAKENRYGYSVGANIGLSLKRQGVNPSDGSMSLEAMVKGLRDAFGPADLQLSDTEIKEALQTYQQEIMAKREADRKAAAETNMRASEAFLAENAKKEDVVTLESGLQYKVINSGTGTSPSAKDTVSVHYRGTLIDGTEFDSSYKNDTPATFQLNKVIPGWTEGLQLMKPGAKWKLFVPPALGYGAQGSRNIIGPNEALIFEVELLSVKAAPKPKPQVVTSDIIKVPSKEELEKGAEIEIIKAEDVEKEIEKQKKAENQPKEDQ